MKQFTSTPTTTPTSTATTTTKMNPISYHFDPNNSHEALSEACKVGLGRSMHTAKPRITPMQVLRAIGWTVVLLVGSFVYLSAPVVGGHK